MVIFTLMGAVHVLGERRQPQARYAASVTGLALEGGGEKAAGAWRKWAGNGSQDRMQVCAVYLFLIFAVAARAAGGGGGAGVGAIYLRVRRTAVGVGVRAKAEVGRAPRPGRSRGSATRRPHISGRVGRTAHQRVHQPPTTATAGLMVPRTSPRWTVLPPRPGALAVMTTSSPSSRKVRVLPSGSVSGSCPPHDSSSSEPR